MIDNSESNSIKITNSQLGELTINKDSIINFNDGIIGFENLRMFAIIEFEETEPFIWFISIDEPDISFPIIKYKYVYPDYELNLSTKNCNDLQIKPSEPFHLFFIITVNEELEQVTANLKGPLIFNYEKKLGIQVISPNDKYIVNYPVVKNNK